MISTLTLPALHASVLVRRDSFGVAHVAAANEPDAFFGQGFVAAQDRLWQMEYDRLRAQGRWAEAAGKDGVAADRLARRMDLARSAQADVAGMSAETRAMFEAYAAGVNAYLQSGRPLPREYQIAGLAPEPWEAWHSCAAFKIRHVLMGTWQRKLAQAQLLTKIGPESYAELDGRSPIGSAVILPPEGSYAGVFEQSVAELRVAAEQLGFLATEQGGSNSWAVHGSRTTTGLPVLCNDSHRALDVPSVYWQVHVTCPEFDAIGATFPGLPGFPHFGHNTQVAWNITHTSADYQDLYLEQFDRDDPARYRTAAGWAPAEHRVEQIKVAGGEPVRIELWRTHHGPVVHGDPRSGVAISLRYTGTEAPNRGFECLRPMLRAKSVAELQETQRAWVDPVNNLVAADVHGNIGYLTRGYLPIRSSQAHRQFPAPGWTGEHEWIGRVPFEQLPQEINPAAGFIATANQAVIPGDEPYIAHDFSAPFRAERIRELILAGGKSAGAEQMPGAGVPKLTPDEIMTWQGDTVSWPARTWAGLLARSGPFTGTAEPARQLLAGWDGNLLPESAPALLYGYFRHAIARALFEPITGKAAYEWMLSADTTAAQAMLTRCMTNVVAAIERDLTTGRSPTGRGGPRVRNIGDLSSASIGAGYSWNEVLPEVLGRAWEEAVAFGGTDPARWRWGSRHRTNANHPLVARFPHLAAELNPPRVEMGGDGDTIQASSYPWRSVPEFDVTGLSVYRQAVDLADIAHASYVIPGGVSGDPASPHWQDQLEYWHRHRRIGMGLGDG
jgi:penicillin G amidase